MRRKYLIAIVAIALSGCSTAALSADRGDRPPTLTVPRNSELSWPGHFHHYVVVISPTALLSATAPGGAEPTAAARTSATPSAPRSQNHRASPAHKRNPAASTSLPGPAAGHAKSASSIGGSSLAGSGGYWEAAAPSSADPIVWRPGQPFSVLKANLAKYPPGTPIERDSLGDIRVVLPHPRHSPVVAAPARPPRNDTGTRYPVSLGRAKNSLPAGYTSVTGRALARLRAVPGVHAAAEAWGNYYAITTSLSAAELKAALPGIVAVDPNDLLSLAATANQPVTGDPSSGYQWYLANSGNAPTYEPSAGFSSESTAGDSPDFAAGWSRSIGSGALIADIDTGADTTNPDLAGAVSPESEDFAVSPPTSDVEPVGTAAGYDHGSEVDGTIAATAGNNYAGAGAAPGVQVLALKCSDDEAIPDSCVYAAGEYAISEGAKIINMSFGAPGADDPVIASLIQDAEDAGVLVVAAAGNDAADNDTTPFYPASFDTSYNNVISVGALDANYAPAYFSDYGQSSVNIFAPGEYVFTTGPGGDNGYVSGTSFAAPLVSAAAAMIWSADPSLTYTQVKNDILTSAQPDAAISNDCSTGGALDVPAALALVPQQISYTFAGFDEVQVGTSANVTVNATAEAGILPTGQALAYKLQLAYDQNGSAYALQGANIAWSSGSSSGTVTTGSDGSAIVDVPGLDQASFGTSTLGLTLPGLTSGTWLLAAQTVNAGSPSTTYGQPEGVFFVDGSASAPPATTGPVTSTSSTTAPVATSPTASPTMPVISTSATTPSSTPTTAAPTTAAPTSAPSTTAAPVTSTPSTSSTATTSPVTTSSATSSSSGTSSSTTAPSTPTTAAPTTNATSTSVPATSTVPPTTAPPATGTSTTTVATTSSTPATTPSSTTTTSAPAASTTTTTPTTGTPASTTTTTQPAVGDANWQVAQVTPNAISTGQADLTVLGNNFPDDPVVDFGSYPAAVQDTSSTFIDVSVDALPPGTYSAIVWNAPQTADAILPDALTVGNGSTSTTSPGATTTSAPVTTGPTSSTTGPSATTSSSPTTTPAPTTASTATTMAPGSTTSGDGSATSTSATTAAAATTTTAALPPGSSLLPSSSTSVDAIPGGMWQAVTAQQYLADTGGAPGSPVPGAVL